MGKTSIEWCDHSINPFRARNLATQKTGHFCVKISPGCKNCYASRFQPRLGMFQYLAPLRDRVELYLAKEALQEVLSRKKPTRYFWCDMTDMFMDGYPDEWIDQCRAVMALTRHHTHLILTKRPERMLQHVLRGNAYGRLLDAVDHIRASQPAFYSIPISNPARFPLRNVHVGVSVENREAKQRIDILRDMPAILRFLSIEPLLEDLGELNLSGIGWVIVGGESGPGSRTCNVVWIRSIVEQCKAAGVPVFCKQLGHHPISTRREAGWEPLFHDQHGESPTGEFAPFGGLKDRKGGDITEFPDDLKVREFPA